MKPETDSPPAMSAIVLENLTRRFPAAKNEPGEITAVDGLTFAVETGEVFGFLGPNGAGKTTTVRMLAALIAPSAGQARVNGHQLGRDNTAIRRSVGILTESPGLYEALTARRNLRFFAGLYGVDDPAGQVDKYLHQFGLADRAAEQTGTFSKGMKQKLALARALLHEPPVLFLDEPTSGLDPAAAKMVRQAIEALSGQGRTVFLCTHNLNEAEQLCDRVGVLNRGRLAALDTPQALRRRLFGQSTLVTLENPSPELAESLRRLPFVQRVETEDSAFRVSLKAGRAGVPDLVAALVNLGGRVQQVVERQASLEEVYLSLVENAE
ncbi:MAG: ABC transporter ATP-binding protein [Anaerolineae bacterium]